MVDQRYELLVVIRTQLELDKALDDLGKKLQGIDTAGAQALGTSSKTAQGARALVGIQGTLAQATNVATNAVQSETKKQGELADVLRILSASAKGGAEAKTALSQISARVSNETLKEIAASRDFVQTQTILARALGVTGANTQLFLAASNEIPGKLAQGTAAVRIAQAAENELADRRKQSVGIIAAILNAENQRKANVVQNTAVFKTLQQAEQETTAATDKFIEGSNLLASSLARTVPVTQAQRSALLASTGVFQTLNQAQTETAKTTEQFVAGSNLLPAVLSKGSAATKELDGVFLGLNNTSKSVSTNLGVFQGSLRDANEAQLKAIASATNYRQAAGGVANVLGLSGAATKLFATQVSDVEGKLRQNTFTTKAAGLASQELERRLSAGNAAQREAALAADAHRASLDTLSRTLVTSVATAGNQLLRLGGITSGFAGQTLGRQFLGGVVQATRGMNLFQKEAEDTTKAVSGLVPPVEEVGAAGAASALAIGGFTAAIAIGAAGALGAASAFKALAAAGIEVSKAFETVAVRAPRETFEQLKSSVFDLAGRTGLAFDSLAEATGRALLKVGGDAAQAQRLVKVSTDLALAGSEDVGKAVEQLGDIMRTYGLSVAEVKDVSNLLLLSQVNSREEFGKIAAGVVSLAEPAKKLGISLKDLTASLAGIVGAGIPAEQATFGLRSVFAELEKEGSTTRKTLQGLKVDLSPEAFATKGLIAQMRDFEAALNRNNLSLTKFLGESRRFPTVLALLGAAAGPAQAILQGLATGTDQAAEGIAKLQALPGRELANFLNELSVLFHELGDALAFALGPSIKSVTELLQEFNAVAREHPEELRNLIKGLAEEFLNLGGEAVGNIPLVGTLIRKTFSVLPTLVDGATGAIAKFRKEMNDLSGTKPPPALENFPLRDEKPKTPKVDELTNELKAAAAGLQDVFDVEIEKNFVKTLTDLIDQGGDAAATIRKLDEALTKHPTVQAAATFATREFETASEKATHTIDDEQKKTTAIIEVFRKHGVSVGALVAKYVDYKQKLVDANQAAAFQEKVQDDSRRGLDAITARLFAYVPAQVAAKNALKSFTDELARMGELAKKGGTGDAGETAFDLERRITKARSAFQGLDAAVDAWRDSQRTGLEQVNEIVRKAEEYKKFTEDTRDALIAAAAVATPELAKKLLESADAFNQAAQKIAGDIANFRKTVVSEQEGGFTGGFQRGIDDFVKHVQDGFKMGQEAANEFANASVDALSNFFLHLDHGKQAIKDFAVAMLQAIEQIIAKMIAFGIVSAVFNSFGGGIGNFFSLFGGGIGGREKGGPVEKKKPYLVGEKGPELFVPEDKGTIVPYSKTLLALGSAPASAFQGRTRRERARAVGRRSLPRDGIDHVPADAADTARPLELLATLPSSRRNQPRVQTSPRPGASPLFFIQKAAASILALPSALSAIFQGSNRARPFAMGGVMPGEMKAPDWGWDHAPRYESGGVAQGLLRSILPAKRKDKARKEPTFRILSSDGGQVLASGTLKTEKVVPEQPSGSPVGALQTSLRLAAGLALAIAPFASSQPARAAVRAAPAASAPAQAVALDRIQRAVVRARALARGGVQAGKLSYVRALEPGKVTQDPSGAGVLVELGTIRAGAPRGLRRVAPQEAQEKPQGTLRDPSIIRSIRGLATPLARLIRALPSAGRARDAASLPAVGAAAPSEIGLDLARTPAGVAARGNDQPLGERVTPQGTAVQGITRFFRTASAQIASLARAIPSAIAPPRAPRREPLAFESGGVARGIVTAIESAGTTAERRIIREAKTGAAPSSTDAAASPTGSRRRPALTRADERRVDAGSTPGVLSSISSSISRIAGAAARLISPGPGSAGAATSSAPGGAARGGSGPGRPTLLGSNAEEGNDRIDFLGRAGSVLGKWAGLVRAMSPREFAMGGVATTPSMAIFAEKPGMAEAFVPLPGPNRGIPVEFKNAPMQAPPPTWSTRNDGPREIHVHVAGVTLISQSLDPRTAGDVLVAQMPALTRALANSIENGVDRGLNNAIKGLR